MEAHDLLSKVRLSDYKWKSSIDLLMLSCTTYCEDCINESCTHRRMSTVAWSLTDSTWTTTGFWSQRRLSMPYDTSVRNDPPTHPHEYSHAICLSIFAGIWLTSDWSGVAESLLRDVFSKMDANEDGQVLNSQCLLTIPCSVLLIEGSDGRLREWTTQIRLQKQNGWRLSVCLFPRQTRS